MNLIQYIIRYIAPKLYNIEPTVWKGPHNNFYEFNCKFSNKVREGYYKRYVKEQLMEVPIILHKKGYRIISITPSKAICLLKEGICLTQQIDS